MKYRRSYILMSRLLTIHGSKASGGGRTTEPFSGILISHYLPCQKVFGVPRNTGPGDYFHRQRFLTVQVSLSQSRHLSKFSGVSFANSCPLFWMCSIYTDQVNQAM